MLRWLAVLDCSVTQIRSLLSENHPEVLVSNKFPSNKLEFIERTLLLWELL